MPKYNFSLDRPSCNTPAARLSNTGIPIFLTCLLRGFALFLSTSTTMLTNSLQCFALCWDINVVIHYGPLVGRIAHNVVRKLRVLTVHACESPHANTPRPRLRPRVCRLLGRFSLARFCPKRTVGLLI